MKAFHVEAVDLTDCWFQFVSGIFEYGYKYIIEHGSFVGNTRLEFPFASAVIKNPYAEPYDLMLPQIPSHYNIPNPVENGYIEQYMPYLMTEEKQEGEDYTYGQRICSALHLITFNDLGHGTAYSEIEYVNQIDYWVGVLKKTPNTNQAVLQLAQPADCLLEDPPCLRSIHLKVINDKLIVYPYFRSNDLWGGFPANLAGIAVLQKFIADEIGVGSGEMIYSCSGLHLYNYVEELAKMRVGKQT